MCALFDSGLPRPVSPIQPAPLKFPRIAGAEIAASIYGSQVAGDFYDCFRVGKERILFGLLDVAGRDETKRPILQAAETIFRSDGAALFSPVDLNESDAMVKLCVRLNLGIMEKAAGVRPCPAFIGCYHERFGTLCYTNAGHTPGLLRDRTGVAELGPTGLSLGLFSHATCEAPTFGMEKGAAILVVSRGVVDGGSGAENGDSAQGTLGLEPIKDKLRTSSARSAEALSEAILQGAVQTVNGPTPSEDMTALVLFRAS